MTTEQLIWTEADVDDIEYEHVIPSKYQVCSGCDGKGSHVHRAIDEHGITQEEFDRDPDFEEEYFAGAYTCHGKRVELVPDWDRDWPGDLKKRYEDHLDDEAYNAAERDAERRMGA